MPQIGERRVRLTLHYDGTHFYGWQLQPGVRTVQAELENVLHRLTTRPTPVVAAGRTDRGVHATGQVASALVSARWTAEELRRALNALLPRDIWVSAAREVPVDFHARFDAIARGYRYRVGTADVARSPFLRRTCWALAQELDHTQLHYCAEALLGEHSFLAFAKAGQPERGDRCTVHHAWWRTWGVAGLEFGIVANRFLHHMVRYVVGTMVDVGRGRRPAEHVAGLLAGEAGLETSPPAPAAGLFLTHVYYPGDELSPAMEEIDEAVPGQR